MDAVFRVGATSFPSLLHPHSIPVLVPLDLHLLLCHPHRALENSVSAPERDLPGGVPLSKIAPQPGLSTHFGHQQLPVCGPSVAKQLQALFSSLQISRVSYTDLVEISHCPFSSCKIDH